MSDATNKAVFLSYASQDAEAARRICEALRAAGVEVWFDQSELRGGDAWDAKIRKQIKECALFVPIISANTQARTEGYFRLEWRLADQRTHLMAKGRAFLVPVVIDETRDSEAHVPDSFTEVQWTRLPRGEGSASFGARVKTLLAGNDVARVAPPASSNDRGQGLTTIAPVRRQVPALAWATAFGVLLAVVAFVVWPRRPAPASSQVSAPAPLPPAAAASPPVASEARQLVARARRLFNQLDETRDDFKLAEELLKQAMAKDSGDAEAWAAYAQLQQRYAARGWDVSDERREEARTATQRALRLDPQSFEARFAQTSLTITATRDVHEREGALRALLRERPDDQRVLRALGSLLRFDPERRDEAIRIYDQSAALPGGDPLALYNKALTLWFAGRASEAEAAVRAALAQKPFVGARLVELFFALSLRGDLERARTLLDKIPTAELLEDRGCYFAYLVHRYRGKPDAALAVVRSFSRDWLDDGWFRGPRGLLAGDALAQAGRPAAAAIEWRAALKVTDTRLAANPNELRALGSRLILLARLGDTEAARKLYPSVRQLVRADTPGVLVPVWFTDACLTLGERPEALRQIRAALASKIHATYYTAADLRYDPTWARLRDDPEFVRLIVEAERVEKADDVVTTESTRNE